MRSSGWAAAAVRSLIFGLIIVVVLAIAAVVGIRWLVGEAPRIAPAEVVARAHR